MNVTVDQLLAIIGRQAVTISVLEAQQAEQQKTSEQGVEHRPLSAVARNGIEKAMDSSRQ